MTRLFFLLSSLNVGGVEKSFLGILTTLPPEQYEIHLGLIHRRGGLLDQLPPYVHIHDIFVYNKLWPIINDPPRNTVWRLFKEGHWGEAAILFILYLWMKLTGGSYWTYRYLLRKEPHLDGEFDAAVAYAGPSQMIDYYICEKVNAKKKYGWIHFDVSRFGIDRGMTRRLYRQYEKIFVVSREAREIFCGIFPEFAGKTEVFYNIVNRDLVRQLAESAPTFNDSFTGRRLLTVGRISQEKGQHTAIRAMKQVLDKHPKTRWYFVGEGKDLAECQDLTHQEGLDDSVVFLGLQKNPYGFMRDCDLYVQPSRHEGYCITLAEALCFEKPVVATSFSGAREQLEGKTDSWIAEFTPESIAESIDSALSSLE
jgi:glycosyltransferase involved in cell wall biosynthesis